LDRVAEPTALEVEVFKAVRAAVQPAFIRRVLTRAATVPEIEARLRPGHSTVAVRVTTDTELRRLNRSYAGEDHSTDVLSFGGSGDHLGDVAISWPAVVRQAAEHGHPERTELALLGVHGLLHLLGWDHAAARERKEMSRLTLEALELSRLRPASGRL
jgi:probable rRNA maturation factor